MSDHVVLVAFCVDANSSKHAQLVLMSKLVGFLPKDGDIEEWWIAEDERFDGSDNESAVFIPRKMRQVDAYNFLRKDNGGMCC